VSTEDIYPVINSNVRPGFGRDLTGNLRTNAFCISLLKDEQSNYSPYLFSDLLQQYNLSPEHLNTCENCLKNHGSHILPCNEYQIDLSAYDQKFSQGDYEVDDSRYQYCPLIQNVFQNSLFEIHNANDSKIKRAITVKPLDTILSGNWDDSYLFQLKGNINSPTLNLCPVIKSFFSTDHISVPTERQFFGLWLQAMFQIMGKVGNNDSIFLGEEDIDWKNSQLFRFIFPIPQVWVQVIPPPPHNVSWQDWNKQHQELKQPQRVDFLFTYRGKRQIIEIDGKTHYSSENEYRKTLYNERWLKVSGFEVHRFTNEEINELFVTRTSNPGGFINLLEMMAVDPTELVFVNHQP
jgi:hypothetical protein